MRSALISIFGVIALYSQISAAGDSAEENLRKTLKVILPDVEVTSVKPSPVSGLYEVMLGPDVVYITADGRYVLRGDLLDLEQRRNLSAEKRAKGRVNILKSIKRDDMIEFAPEHVKHTIYVFTDVDCTYCRKLHNEMSLLNQNGIAVLYLAFPRAGIGSSTYNKMVSVWCADDRNQALTDAKAGQAIETKSCNAPVKEQYEIGQLMGVKGTPAIVLENGQELGGYVPANELAKLLDGSQN
ncbi:MAG: DsbC family protein [Gammaproteobacteria bacterium]|nr:DsbC family protein [Gammaproteobacteria bacterium]MCI0590214.1 DsbC family protein [Gammaproteobacteria bacterium]